MSATVAVGRRRVEISRPDKPLFPCGIAKRDLAHYYERVARTMLIHVADRPLNMERYPDGINGQRIIQQRASDHFPQWIRRVRVPARDHTVDHVVAGEPATLVYLAGQACITVHPWLCRRDNLNRPDRLVVDLDPSTRRLAELRRGARLIGDLLRELGLEPWAMTTGSRGYHVVVPLKRSAEFDSVRAFARGVAAVAAAREPRLFTVEQRKAKRQGRILIDVMRNAYAHTSVAAYAVRARAGAPVATPLHWEELSDARTTPTRWTLKTLPKRLEREGDLWEGLPRQGQTLRAAHRRLDQARAELPQEEPRERPARRPLRRLRTSA